MKSRFPKLIMFPVLLGCALLGCSDDNGNPPISEGLAGEWRLVQVSGGFSGQVIDYPLDLIRWKFNTGNVLTVVNNYPNDGGLDDGVYPYQITVSEVPEMCSETVTIDGVSFGCMILSENDNHLTLNSNYLDGLKWDFVRVTD